MSGWTPSAALGTLRPVLLMRWEAEQMEPDQREALADCWPTAGRGRRQFSSLRADAPLVWEVVCGDATHGCFCDRLLAALMQIDRLGTQCGHGSTRSRVSLVDPYDGYLKGRAMLVQPERCIPEVIDGSRL